MRFSFLLAAIMLLGAATLGSQSAFASSADRYYAEAGSYNQYHHHRHHHHHHHGYYGYHGHHAKSVPKAASLRKLSY